MTVANDQKIIINMTDSSQPLCLQALKLFFSLDTHNICHRSIYVDRTAFRVGFQTFSFDIFYRYIDICCTHKNIIDMSSTISKSYVYVHICILYIYEGVSESSQTRSKKKCWLNFTLQLFLDSLSPKLWKRLWTCRKTDQYLI
jgi:hypothetical protein